jgi:hypothetical protein
MHSRLTKHHAERLVNAMDTSECYTEVLQALRWLLDSAVGVTGDLNFASVESLATDAEVVEKAAGIARWPSEIARLILARDPDALAETAAELSELRCLQRDTGSAR